MQLTKYLFASYFKGFSQKVGVFGTLKRGNPNHYRMLDKKNGEAKFVGNGITKQRYPLVIASQANIPFILNQIGVGHNVHVEMYHVNGEMKQYLDKLENVGVLYDIEEIDILLENGLEEKMPMYMLNQFKAQLLDLKYHESYTKELAKTYLKPEERSFTIFDVVKEVKEN